MVFTALTTLRRHLPAITPLAASLLALGLSACASHPVARVVVAPMNPPHLQFTPAAAPAPSGQPVVADTTASDAPVLPADDDTLAQVDMDPVDQSPDELSRFGDIWERVRRGFELKIDADNDRISAQRSWYLQHQDYLDRMSARAGRYLFYTVSEAEKRGIPTELALLPVIESGYDPFALSRAQASGMWQLIPGTAKVLGIRQSWWYDGRRDIVESTRAAYDFLVALHEKFGDWYLALAAYNAGPGLVERAVERNQAAGLPTDYWSLHLPAETMSYVPRFIAVAQLISDPAKYGVSFLPIVNAPHFRVVNMPSQFDLARAADLAGLTTDELYQLNPAYNHWATDPDGPHRLLVPSDTPADFETRLAALPAPEKVQLVHYHVRRGDSLARIASRYHVSASELMRMNNLASNHVHRGEDITVVQADPDSQSFSQAQEERLARLEAAAGSGQQNHTYKVRRGDTLLSVARRHHVSPRELAQWNGIGLHARLRPGEHLSIHGGGGAGSHIALHSRHHGRHVAEGDHERTARLHRISYEVRRGDTLRKIASRYRVSVSQIQSWNGRQHHIKPGQDIVLYVAANTHTDARRADDF